MAKCPNCSAPIAWNASKCLGCSTKFAGNTNLRPLPETPEEQEKLALKYDGRGGISSTAIFDVRFSPRFDWSGVSTNSYRLTGKGEIGISASNRFIVIRGKSRWRFAVSADNEIFLDRAHIFNVIRDGKSLRFEILPEGEMGKRDFITLFATNEQSAVALAERLPQERTPKFAQQQADLLDFKIRLDRVTPRAYVTPALVAINILVFVAMLGNGAGFMNPDGQVHARWGSNFGPLTTGGEWWRLFTSMFLHFGAIHLAANMAALYDTGRIVEKLFGNVRFLVLYLFSGLAGGLASLLWHPEVNSAGASGAIFGVFGGLLAYMLNRDNRVPLTVMKQQRTTTIIFIGYSLFYGFSHEGIDNAAHLGGLAGGLVMGLLLARPLDVAQRTSVGIRRFVTALVLGTAVLGLMSLPIKDVSGTYKKEQQYRQDLTWFIEEEKQLTESIMQWQRTVSTGMLSDAQLADQLDKTVVARWESVHARLSAHPLDAPSRAREQQELLIDYVTSRRDAYRLLLQGIRSNDHGKAKEFNSRIAAGNRIIEQLKQTAPKK